MAGGERKEHLRSNTSMLIILPDADEFANIIENIQSIYTESKDNLSEQEITVRLPKFSFMTSSYDMKKYLKDMGINRIFENRESLEKISNDESIKIDGMFHKTSISIDEKGVEAKATSNGIMTCEGFTDKIVHFNANRPFIFFIRDLRTEQILFMGVIRNPIP